MNLVRAHVFVEGRVQGVFYRDSARRRAQELGLTGWVRNLPDGRVEAVLEGDASAVAATVAYLREGPPHAQVRSVEVAYEPFTGEFSDFSVSY